MILRDFKKEDPATIAGWIQSEEELYKWSADRFNKYPLSGNNINENYRPQLEKGRFGFVIVNPALRGKGNGKEMLRLGVEYVKKKPAVSRIELGVFENNESARRCYEAVGFKEYAVRECAMPIGTWNCLDMALSIEKQHETTT